MRRSYRVVVLGLCCAAMTGAALAAPARFAIDPVPGSPSLGDLLDREAARLAVPVVPPRRPAVAEPVLPRNAAVVHVKRAVRRAKR